MRAKIDNALSHRSAGVSATVIHFSFNIPLALPMFSGHGVLIKKVKILGEGKTLQCVPEKFVPL